MSTRRLCAGIVSMLILITCFGGFVRADNPYDLEATTGYPVAEELLVYISLHSGVLSHVVTTGNTKAIMYTRATASTPAWSVQSDSDETYGYYRVLPGEAEDQSGKICCSFTCGAWVLDYDPALHTCWGTGNDCRLCSQTCTGGHSSCPHQYPFLEVID